LNIGTLPQDKHSSFITQKVNDNFSFIMKNASYSLNGVREKLIMPRAIRKVGARTKRYSSFSF